MSLISLPPPFQLPRYFAENEFKPGTIVLSASDIEAWKMSDIVEMADPECKALWENHKLTYTNTKGFPPLLTEIAKLHGVEREDIITINPQEGIYIAMTCLVAYIQRKYGLNKFHAIATYPGYQGLYETLKTIHKVQCDFEEWRLHYTNDGWRLYLDELKSLIRDNTKVLIVNFPHNPTGYMPNAEEWQEIVALCKDMGIILFSDEMYRLTNNDGSPPLTTACSMAEDAITLFGMSKAYALPGLRIGWLCSKNKDIMKKIQELKDYTSTCGPGPCEVLSLIALRNGDEVLNRSVGIIKENLTLWNSFLKKHPDIFDWHPPRACSTGFLRLQGWLLDDIGEGYATGVCKVLLEQAKILLTPSAIFGYEDVFVRVSFARINTKEGLERFEEFLQKQQPR